MYKYWVIINDSKLGPLTIGELEQAKICPDTPVWRPGLADPSPPPVAPVPPVPRSRILYGSQVPGAPAPQSDPRNQEPMPPTYLAWSIIVTILCCIPCGIVAIYFSAQVSSRYESGDIKGALQASDRAQLWIILSFVLGLITTPFFMLTLL